MPRKICVQCNVCHVYQVNREADLRNWQCKSCGANRKSFKECFRGIASECERYAETFNREHELQAEERFRDAIAEFEEMCRPSEAVLDAYAELQEAGII